MHEPHVLHFQSYKYFNSYQKLPSMNFQDNLEKVRDLFVVLSFISIREITLYFLVHFKSKKYYYYFFYFSIFYTVFNYIYGFWFETTTTNKFEKKSLISLIHWFSYLLKLLLQTTLMVLFLKFLKQNVIKNMCSETTRRF